MSTVVLQKFSPKWVLASCLTLNVVSLLVFTMTKEYLVLVLCRIATGLFQVYFCIFLPVWADIYGNETQKSTWLTYLLISNPVGVILGYIICASIQNSIGWRWAFYIQSIMIFPCIVAIMLAPPEYMDINWMAQEVERLKRETTAKARKKDPLGLTIVAE